MAYTVTKDVGSMGTMMAGIFTATGTGANFTITPNMRIADIAIFNVTTGLGQVASSAAVTTGVYTITPTNANDTIRVTFTGVPN